MVTATYSLGYKTANNATEAAALVKNVFSCDKWWSTRRETSAKKAAAARREREEKKWLLVEPVAAVSDQLRGKPQRRKEQKQQLFQNFRNEESCHNLLP